MSTTTKVIVGILIAGLAIGVCVTLSNKSKKAKQAAADKAAADKAAAEKKS